MRFRPSRFCETRHCILCICPRGKYRRVGVIVLCHRRLSHHRFGPLGWLWRSLTYRKRQPMRFT
ncbi:MAG: DUF418 domain-containing protein [Candidatus Zixiibacteriota bacterium]|nr:MAG: DUF418 domain-containing protein [candidate division Zixibacteria bacterium]